MKKLIIVVVVLLVASLSFGIVCQWPECPIDVPYDPALVNYRSLGDITLETGLLWVKDMNACDEDETNAGFDWELIRGPNDMMLLPTGRLSWTPDAEGTYYVDIRVWDQPPTPVNSKKDEGSFVIRVIKPNKPPAIGGCGQ
jgi:hypothetical protein